MRIYCIKQGEGWWIAQKLLASAYGNEVCRVFNCKPYDHVWSEVETGMFINLVGSETICIDLIACENTHQFNLPPWIEKRKDQH